MKTSIKAQRLICTFLLTFLLCCSGNGHSQNLIEIPYKHYSTELAQLENNLVPYHEDDLKSIKLCKELLSKTKDPEVKYDLIYWKLPFMYAKLGKYQSCLDILQSGQNEGMFFFLRTGEHTFPKFLTELQKLEGFEPFLKKNKHLAKESNISSKAEYMVQLPENYDESREYPLLLIMHGGIGSIESLQKHYDSDLLSKKFIVARFQGSYQNGTYTRSFDREQWQNNIIAGLEQISEKYSIDKGKVILAGPSAGGYKSIELGLKNLIPAKGLLISFGVAPGDVDSTAYKQAAKRGLKVALLCGENDWAISRQKKLAYLLDKYGIENRFIVFPEEGHNFPDNWPHHMDTSLSFILKDTKSDLKAVAK